MNAEDDETGNEVSIDLIYLERDLQKKTKIYKFVQKKYPRKFYDHIIFTQPKYIYAMTIRFPNATTLRYQHLRVVFKKGDGRC
jgi:hypothetical protein